MDLGIGFALHLGDDLLELFERPESQVLALQGRDDHLGCGERVGG